jgi:hypothetical protein
MKRMHDPKFEKEVQKKLEELSFSPSEAVWTRVERAVNEKRRRRTPLFWFFLLPSLGLAGAGLIYFAKHQTTPAIQVVRTVPVSAPALASSPAPMSAPASSTPGDKAAARNVSGKQTPSDQTIHPNSISSLDPATHPGINTLSDATAHQDITTSSDPGVHQDIAFPRDPAARQDRASGSVSHAGLPGLRPFDHRIAAPTASRLAGSSAIPAAETPTNLKPKYVWEMGFAGGVGLSSLNTSLFQQPAVAASDVQALTSPTPVNASYKTPTSGVQPDISYWAGIVAQRPLSKALTLSLGLDLHYYSTRQQIGEAVYSNPASLYQASTFFNYQQTTNTATQAAVYPYYSVGNTDVFTNRYYFLELPVSIVWKVNHSRKLPLFWENGLSLTYLVSTSSIYYNAKSGVFYKDQGSMANKTQLNLSTALLVGLPIKSMRLQAGPQLQYGLTSLQHQSSVGQHLFFGGIRIVLIPGKVKK